ncbi:MAG: peptidyl-prolyl cis-trans isomerase [Geopsychrobacter sp.]|nr:peptidyl-prolyl cis-trans isomerase [Geopsychrobacter sp.]
MGPRQITLDRFRQEIQPLQTELGQLPEEQQRLLLRQSLTQLIDQELLLAEAEQRGITINPPEMQQALTELRGNYTAEEYQEVLRSSGRDTTHWEEQLRIRLLSEKAAASITRGKIHISATQIEEYYLQHLEDYRRPEQLQARQILLANEAEAIALRKRLLAGKSFAELARQHSLSPERINGGELNLFAPGQFPAEVDKILFNLAKGRISPPIKSPYGVHLFLIENHFAARVLSLEDVAPAIRLRLKTKEKNRLFQKWLRTLRDRTEVIIDWEQLDKLHFDKAE